jgi:phosphoglycolate phosphatase
MAKTVKKTILFDLDGTIIDPKEGIVKSYSRALIELGYSDKVDKNMDWVIGPPLRRSFASILPAAKIEEAVALYRSFHAKSGLIEANIYQDIWQVIESIAARGHRLFICTAKNTPFARKNIEQFELTQFFEEIYGSHLDGKFDDKAELIAHILDAHLLEANQTIMIGDREHDIIAAKKNNVNGYGALWGYGSEGELSDAGAAQLFETPNDFLEFVICDSECA